LLPVTAQTGFIDDSFTRTLADWIDESMSSWPDGATFRPNNPKIPPSSNPIFRFHESSFSAAAEPMRWALAMTE
jgi:hypothetical protein